MRPHSVNWCGRIEQEVRANLGPDACYATTSLVGLWVGIYDCIDY